MPAIAIVAAVGTVSAGAAMGGILGGIMMAGGVMSGLGAVTGNKELSKWGMIASLGAGIGSAMGLASAADGLANSVTGAAPGDALFAQSTKSIGDVASSAASGIKDTLGMGTSAAPATSVMSQPAGGIVSGNMGGLGSGANIPIQPEAAQMFSQTPATSSLAMPAASGPVPQSSLGTGFNSGLQPAAAATEKGFIGSALEFIKNKDNAELLKMGGGLVSGAMKSHSEQSAAEADYERKQQMANEARARYNASITNQPRTIIRG